MDTGDDNIVEYWKKMDTCDFTSIGAYNNNIKCNNTFSC